MPLSIVLKIKRNTQAEALFREEIKKPELKKKKNIFLKKKWEVIFRFHFIINLVA